MNYERNTINILDNNKLIKLEIDDLHLEGNDYYTNEILAYYISFGRLIELDLERSLGFLSVVTIGFRPILFAYGLGSFT